MHSPLGWPSAAPGSRSIPLAVVVALGLATAGCAESITDARDGPGSPRPVEVSDSVEPGDQPPALEVDLVDGMEGTCAYVPTTDPELDTRTTDAIDASVDHGHLVLAVDDTYTVVGTTLYSEPGVQGDAAVWRVEDSALVAISEPAARISDVEVDLVDGGGESRLAQLLAIVQDCSWVVADRGAPDPPEPTPTVRSDLMTVEPDPASPGELVSLAFPQDTPRGIGFVLQRRTDGGWETSHLMTSDANGDAYMDTAPVDTDLFDVIDVGIDGPGPDHVRLPEALAVGDHRICTDNAGDEFCAHLQVVD